MADAGVLQRISKTDDELKAISKLDLWARFLYGRTDKIPAGLRAFLSVRTLKW